DLKTESAKKLLGEGKESAGGAADIDDAKISPDGRWGGFRGEHEGGGGGWVSFLREDEVGVVSSVGGETRQLTHGGSEEIRNGELDWVYPEELDLGTAYWWAPDSSKIALLQLDERAVQKYPLVDELPYAPTVTEERFPEAGSPNPV